MGWSRAVQWIHESNWEKQTCSTQSWGKVLFGVEEKLLVTETGHIAVLVTNKKRQCLPECLTAHMDDQWHPKMTCFTYFPFIVHTNVLLYDFKKSWSFEVTDLCCALFFFLSLLSPGYEALAAGTGMLL